MVIAAALGTLLAIQSGQEPLSTVRFEEPLVEAAPGGKTALTLVFRHKAGWHSYWKNPGDSGQPPTVKWNLPAGWKVGPPAFEPPHMLRTEHETTFGYKDTTVMTFDVEVPRGAERKQHRITADVRWLVCDKECVIVQSEAATIVRVNPRATPNVVAKNWEMKALPKDNVSVFADSGKVKMVVATQGTSFAGARTVQFFPEDEATIDHHTMDWTLNEQGIATLTMAPSPYLSGELKRIKGVLVARWTAIGKKAVYTTIDLPAPKMLQ